jgi:hypothetical protein
MIIKLNKDSTITVMPREVPENLNNVFISYIFPKGLNHLQPVLIWGTEVFEGQNRCVSKSPTGFNMKVILYDGKQVYKEYKSDVVPELYVGYNIELLEPNLCKYVRALEKEVTELKEKGDVL